MLDCWCLDNSRYGLSVTFYNGNAPQRFSYFYCLVRELRNQGIYSDTCESAPPGKVDVRYHRDVYRGIFPITELTLTSPPVDELYLLVNHGPNRVIVHRDEFERCAVVAGILPSRIVPSFASTLIGYAGSPGNVLSICDLSGLNSASDEDRESLLMEEEETIFTAVYWNAKKLGANFEDTHFERMVEKRAMTKAMEFWLNRCLEYSERADDVYPYLDMGRDVPTQMDIAELAQDETWADPDAYHIFVPDLIYNCATHADVGKELIRSEFDPNLLDYPPFLFDQESILLEETALCQELLRYIRGGVNPAFTFEGYFRHVAISLWGEKAVVESGYYPSCEQLLGAEHFVFNVLGANARRRNELDRAWQDAADQIDLDYVQETDADYSDDDGFVDYEGREQFDAEEEAWAAEFGREPWSAH